MLVSGCVAITGAGGVVRVVVVVLVVVVVVVLVVGVMAVVCVGCVVVGIVVSEGVIEEAWVVCWFATSATRSVVVDVCRWERVKLMMRQYTCCT